MKSPLRLAKPQDVRVLGIEPVAEDQRNGELTKSLDALRRNLRSLGVMLDNCTKCGNCMRECHSYLGTNDYHNIPAARADLMRRLYKRHFTLAGRLLGRFVGAADIDRDTIERWVTYFYQCNECRRCAVFLSHGNRYGGDHHRRSSYSVRVGHRAQVHARGSRQSAKNRQQYGYSPAGALGFRRVSRGGDERGNRPRYPHPCGSAQLRCPSHSIVG